MESFLKLFHETTKSGDGWSAHCPAHDDQNPSLSISQGYDERILINCQAGCTPKAVCSALDITISDLFPDKLRTNRSNRREVATYNYTDEHGKLLIQVVRFEPKEFRQRRPDPNSKEEWIYKVQGIRRVPYRLPELIQGIRSGKTIYVVEGEKDSDALQKLGYVATCNAMGGSKWRQEHAGCLKGAREVVIIADKDTPGRKHAELVARSLDGKVDSIKVIELPDLDGKPVKDSSDWINAGGTIGDLEHLVKQTPEFTIPRKSKKVPGNLTPNDWFKEKFPGLSERFGDPFHEKVNEEDGTVTVVGLSEDCIAATLSDKARPDEPCVFIREEGRFYQYDPQKGFFIVRTENEIALYLSATLLECSRACSGNVDISNLKYRMRDTKVLSGIIQRAKGLLAVSIEYFNEDLTEYILVKNGVLRIIDRTLLPFDPKYRRRNRINVSFDPDANCRLFIETLLAQALEKGDVEVFQRCCGQFLIGKNMAQKILILCGTAGAGKGVLIRVIKGIIGPNNVGSLRPKHLEDRFEISRHVGRTLLYGPDVASDFLNQKSAGAIKSLTGGDPMTAEFKNCNEVVNLVCRFNILVTSNSRLTVHLEGDVGAWRRRLVVIRFNKPKPEPEIVDLSEQIIAKEGAGVFNWMLDGLDKVIADKWTIRLSEYHQQIVDDLLLESDSITEFFRHCVKKSEGTLTVVDSYGAYIEFCENKGWDSIIRTKFGSQAPEVVRQIHHVATRHDIAPKSQRGWKGLSVVLQEESNLEMASELSEAESSDASDTIVPVNAYKNLVEYRI